MLTRSKKREDGPPAELHVVNRMSGIAIEDPLIERQKRRKQLEKKCILEQDNRVLVYDKKLPVEVEDRSPGTSDYVRVQKTRKRRVHPTESNTEVAIQPPRKSDHARVQKARKIKRSTIESDQDEDEGTVDFDLPIVADAMDLLSHTKIDYRNPPPGVLGAGRGTGHGLLPEFEFRGVWQKYVLPELDAKNPTPWLQDPAIPPKDMKPIILSVVASVSMGCELDLEDIAKRGRDLNYNPDAFTPLVMRIRKPNSTALVFKSGKMVVTGTKSEVDCRVATRRFARIIQKLGYRVSTAGMVIQNISATCNLGFRVRVHLFGGDKLLGNQIGYHPELFTGVSIPLIWPKVKVMIFRTGAVLITGATAESDLSEALRIVYPFAKMYAN